MIATKLHVHLEVTNAHLLLNLKISTNKQHSLENTIEEYIVENKRLQNLLKENKQKYSELLKANNFEKKKEMKDYIK